MAAIRGRGPQVVLEGYARTVARGAAGRTMRDNIAAMDALVSAGLVADGSTVDGTSRTGEQPYDPVVAQFPHEPLSDWEIPSPLLNVIGGPSGALSPTSGSVAAVSQNLVPARHLSNLAGKTSATIAIIGDSTATAGPPQSATTGAVIGNGVDPTQMVWSLLCDKLKSDNPQITTWNFVNLAIGATIENGPPKIGSDLGVPLPSWFTDPAQTWLSYVQAAAPDVLFWLFGTNGCLSGVASGTSASTFIEDSFKIIDAWTYVPNIILVTNKGGNPQHDVAVPVGDYANGFGRKAQAAFHRTFAQSNAAGYVTFNNVKAKGFGLVDLGRHYVCRIYGYDPASQYLRARPEYIMTGKILDYGAMTGIGASTMGVTLHGDYRLTFVLPAAGGAYMYNLNGGFVRIGAGGFYNNHLRLLIAADGTLTPAYVYYGLNLINGTAVPTTAGQDIVVTVGMAGPRVQCVINGVLAMDVSAPRWVSEVLGGTPINVNFNQPPSGTTPLNVIEFYEGVGTPTPITSNMDETFGKYGAGTPLVPDFTGGNTVNHQTSVSAAVDRELINAMHFTAPSAGTFAGPVTVSGGTITQDNATSNALLQRNAGFAAPAFTTRSVGTRISLSNGTLSGAATEYAIGMATNVFWQSVATSGGIFQWYQGITEIARLVASPIRWRVGLLGTNAYLDFIPGTTGATPSVISGNAGGPGVTFNLNTGFNNATPIAKPTVSGSRGGNAALASLITALANYGLVTDSTTA